MHERSIFQLKFQRNGLALPSRLPPEVLGTIFGFAVATQNGGGRPSSWFNFSYVCRLWRNVALAVPSIWCSIPLHCQQWATAMLERSKSADLILDFNFAAVSSTSPRGQFMKNVLENHTSRIRELSLRGLSSSTLSTLLHDIRPSSFRLRSLKLVCGYNHANPSFPISIMANSEGLLDLDVEKCGIAWFSMPLTGLTSLKMASNPTRPLWSEFMEALGGMPSLETLEIRDSLPLAGELCRRTSNPIKLTKLRRLDLDSTTDINEVLNVLSYIVVPQVASIKIRGRSTPHNTSLSLISDSASSLSRFMSEMISEDNHPVFYQELDAISSYSQLELKAWRSDNKSDRVWRTPDLEISISYLSHSSEKVLQEFIKRLPLSKLKSLGLKADACNETTLLECFGNLQQLGSVTLHGCVTRSFLQMLIVKKGKGRDRKSYYKVTCPALRSLKIMRATLSPDHEDGFSFEELEDCLMERCHRNAELRKLILSGCVDLFEEDVDLLREVVVDVDWDQWEEEYKPEVSDEDDEDMYSSDYFDDDYFDDGYDDHYFPF